VVQPLVAAIPLPLAWDDFSREVQRLRHAYYERMIGPLLEATRQRFVLTGETAADTCSFLNGGRCQCKPRSEATGELAMSEPRGDGDSQMVAGVGVVKTNDAVSNASQHLHVALRSPTRSEGHSSVVIYQQDGNYIDFHGRIWHSRKWLALDRDQETISMERALDDGHIVLTRSVPTALDYAAQLQLEFIANLVYYQCEQASGEGVARLALNRAR
jgi:hypothetical protein